MLNMLTKRTWAVAAAGLAAISLTADGIAGFKVLGEVSPLATKAWVLAEAESLTRAINNLEWGAIRDRRDALQAQIPDDQFKIIQLQDQIAAEPPPGDITKRQLLRQLEDGLKYKQRMVERLDCQLENQYGGNPERC